MAITIKEMHVRTSITRTVKEITLPLETIREIKEEIVREIREELRNVHTSKRER